MKRRPPMAGFDDYLVETNLAGARLAALLVAALMPAGIVLDWFTHPTYTSTFLALRLAASVGSVAVWCLTYLPSARRFTFSLGLSPAIFGSWSIAAMINRIEGFASPYYAGLNLCILGMGIVFTWKIRETVLACAAIVAFWLVPALLAGPSTDFSMFFNNLYFLALTSVIAIASNETRYRQVRREFEGREKLAEASKKLGQALEQLKELDRIKTEFFMNISHELRTPLTLILTPVEDHLSRGKGSPGDRRLFEVIQRNAYRLLRLIDDLLDLSRIDAGRLRLRVASVDLPNLAASSIETFRPAAASRSIDLALDGPSTVENVFGDAHRLEMVLTNLLGNALKFTPDGGRISVEIGEEEDLVWLAVADTGPGIPEEEQARIFERFYRAEGTRPAIGGAGIGLSLARQLIELHGGRLDLDPKQDDGAVFRVVLPKGRDHFRPEVLDRRKVAFDVPGGRRASDVESTDMAAAVVPPETPPDVPAAPIVLEGGRRARIALVEDNEEILELLEGLLAPSFDLLSATDGEAGLSLVQRERPDLVVSDVMMPRLSGTDLCARIKADPLLQSTPVILLTARSGPEAVLEGYAHGADDFVTKPLHPRILVARVRAQLRLRAMGLQVVSQAKLAAVGTLAAGVGHEVRNPVNAVVNGARALLERHTLDPGMRRIVEVIEEAGRRIESISAALLDHAHPGEQDRTRLCDVRAGIDATLRLLEHRAGGVAVHRLYESDRLVVASAAELNQVFMNLLDNALRSSARNVWVRVAQRADRVSVAIEDDGPGVPPAIAGRIFDPFFTTRDPGAGTGLGLYLSSRIVTKYGGVLRHDPRPETGAIFTLELPAERAA